MRKRQQQQQSQLKWEKECVPSVSSSCCSLKTGHCCAVHQHELDLQRELILILQNSHTCITYTVKRINTEHKGKVGQSEVAIGSSSLPFLCAQQQTERSENPAFKK